MPVRNLGTHIFVQIDHCEAADKATCIAHRQGQGFTHLATTVSTAVFNHDHFKTPADNPGCNRPDMDGCIVLVFGK